MYIAICGPSGAGKDTAADMIAKDLNYVHVSGGDLLRDMLSTIGFEPKKSAIGPFGVFIRENYGVTALFERVAAMAEGNEGLVISGIRSPDEIKLVQSKGGKVIFIDADRSIRYERIISRSRKGDTITVEQFSDIEAQERNGTLGHQQNLDTVRRLSDVIVRNHGTLDELRTNLVAVIRGL